MQDHEPGTSRRIQLIGEGDEVSSVLSIFSAKKTPDMYVVPRMLGGEMKISLHASGSWQAGLTKESAVDLQAGESRHWEIWKGGAQIGPGVVRAWYLIVPAKELRRGKRDDKAYHLPPVGAGHAVSLELLMMANDGPTLMFDDIHIVGTWRLAGRDERCVVVARRIPWGEDVQAWAAEYRAQVAAQTAAAGIERTPEHRYYLHGHDPQGVRFGLELAAEAA